MRIINDPIIMASLAVGWGLLSRLAEPKLTRCPRLCDLMSPAGLAYLSLGI
jgi:hypothetical protein